MRGVCASDGHGKAGSEPGKTLDLAWSAEGNTNAGLPSGCAVHGSAPSGLDDRVSPLKIGESNLGRCEGDLFRPSSSGLRRPRRGLIWGNKARNAISSSAATPSRPSSHIGLRSVGI